MERTKIQITDTDRCFQGFLTRTVHTYTVRVKKLLFYLYITSDHLQRLSVWVLGQLTRKSFSVARVKAV